MYNEIRYKIISVLCCILVVFQSSASAAHRRLEFQEVKNEMSENTSFYSVKYLASVKPQVEWMSGSSVLFPDTSTSMTHSYDGNKGELTITLTFTPRYPIKLWIQEQEMSYTIKFRSQSLASSIETNFPEISLQTNLNFNTEYGKHQMLPVSFEADVENTNYNLKHIFWMLALLNGTRVTFNYGANLPQFSSDNGPVLEVKQHAASLNRMEYEIPTDDLNDGGILSVEIIAAPKNTNSPVEEIRQGYSFMLHPASAPGPFAEGSVGIVEQPPVLCFGNEPCSITCSVYGYRPLTVTLLEADADGSAEELTDARRTEMRGENWIDTVFPVTRSGTYVCYAVSQLNFVQSRVRVFKL